MKTFVSILFLKDMCRELAFVIKHVTVPEISVSLAGYRIRMTALSK